MEKLSLWFVQHLPALNVFNISIGIIDVIEIIILSFLVYTILVWMKNTRAWKLLQGIMILGVFVGLTYVLRMDTLKFIIHKGISTAVIAAVIIFQPELRKALEQLGDIKVLSNFLDLGGEKEVEQRCSDRTVSELINAVMVMSRAKTGALIVIEEDETLEEYEKTGIDIDAIVSSQLLINIFEHNTPLHDGAVIIRGDKIASATCYLPLSENTRLSKALGTRHRAGVGISEVTDSLTIIVSEETGSVSIAHRGVLQHGLREQQLHENLLLLQNKTVVAKKGLVGMTLRKKKEKGSDEE